MTTQVIVAGAAAFSTIVAAYFTILVRRVQNDSPETVAGGYSVLVKDLRDDMGRLREDNEAIRGELSEMTEEMKVVRRRNACMERKIAWLTQRLSKDDRLQFREAFPESRMMDE